MTSKFLKVTALPAMLMMGTAMAWAQEPASPSPSKSPPAATEPAPAPQAPAEIMPDKSDSSSMKSDSSSMKPEAASSSTAFTTQQSADQYRSSAIVGRSVYNAASENIGDINELLVDASGKVSSAVIGVGGFLGLGEKLVAVPFSDLKFTTEPNGSVRITLNSTKDALETAPEFKYKDAKSG